MNAVQWFEIPALDLERAFAFYHTILDAHVRKGSFGNGDLILFDVPFNTGEAVGGAALRRFPTGRQQFFVPQRRTR